MPALLTSRIVAALSAAVFLSSVATVAQDVAGSKDHPAISRYAASVFVARNTNPGVPRSPNRAVVLLEIIEPTPMETGLVTVDAAAMATSEHGVAATRLRAVGVGMAAPVASNATEDGRAKNRRVELVRL